MEHGATICLLYLNGHVIAKSKERADDDRSNLPLGCLDFRPFEGAHGPKNGIRCLLCIRLYEGRAQLRKFVIKPGLGDVGGEIRPEPFQRPRR